MFVNRLLTYLLLLFICWTGTGTAQAQAGSACGPLYSQGQYGPYDFRTDKDKLPIVLGTHFPQEVEALIRGRTSARPGPDIDYTLRAIPNHPNALMSMMLLGEKEKTPQPNGSRYTVECWFQRALQFRPDDVVARMLYTSYLTKNGRKPEALQQLEFIETAAKDNAFTHQNVGLLYSDLGEYPKALIHAHKAIELGLNRPELREKLQAAGKWVEPAASAPESGASSPAAASSSAQP
jgi:tetratricopeptide (TPR) repeat protein